MNSCVFCGDPIDDEFDICENCELEEHYESNGFYDPDTYDHFDDPDYDPDIWGMDYDPDID